MLCLNLVCKRKTVLSVLNVILILCNVSMGSNIFQYLKRGADRPIYVISRIKQLCSEITNFALKGHSSISVLDIPLPDNSDIIHPSDIARLSDADVVVADPKILAFNYKNMPSLKWAYCTWAGVEPLFEFIKEKPSFVITRHGGDDFCNLMAEYVMTQVLNYEYNFKGIWEGENERSWSKMLMNFNSNSKNRSLKDLNIGILGVGNMGQAVAKFFKPHGTTLTGLSRNPRQPDEFGYFDKIVTILDDVLSTSDYIVNTLPSTKETVGLLNGQVLKACSKKPVFINVGRASIIKEDDLIFALSNQWLSWAILDVFKEEPLPPDSPLWGKVTVTPHIAAVSQPNYIAKDFLMMLESYENNGPLRNIVNWEAGY